MVALVPELAHNAHDGDRQPDRAIEAELAWIGQICDPKTGQRSEKEKDAPALAGLLARGNAFPVSEEQLFTPGLRLNIECPLQLSNPGFMWARPATFQPGR